MLDAVVVGSGPNGLAAAITLAEQGHSVQLVEAADTPGGGCRTAELTLPGFRHDVCSVVQGLAEISPFFRNLDLEAHGVRLRRPEIAYAHPLDGGRAGAAYADLARTGDALGVDGRAWTSLFGPFVRHTDELMAEVLGDLRHLPRHPLLMARFGLTGLRPVHALARARFDTDLGRALFAGVGAHSMRKLTAPLTSAFGIALGVTAHAGGWPVVEGGSGRLVDALVGRAIELGVEIACGEPVRSLRALPPARVKLLAVTPRQLAQIGADDLPGPYLRRLTRFRYGPGVFKVDYALSGPVPWAAAQCRAAGTVHVGGTLDEVAASEADVEAGRHSDRPFVLAVQPGVADPTRAPEGQHTLWTYCHVPHGSTLDRTAAIEAQLERFAPGFRDLVLARATRTAAQYEAYDANYVGGDINGGRAGLYQAVLGPVPAWSRYRTPLPGVYLCSSSTPPGGGVHGMCGVHAAREAMHRELRATSAMVAA
ncbi:phytoene desaturase family protein [uncultured Jatrophihabitans sp.]|uniref:phytoene desaturase family protein n=1 Tax=uncultured Jatrophihabitans sp. TaxID=1610747 RepID=UPI0035CC38AE